MKRIALFILAAASCMALSAQTVIVKDTVMTTYPYSDPDPVPRMGKIFPYWHFQEFSQTPVQQTWKMVVLENDYLRVKIFPQIGGKVWSIYDKTAGKEMVYDNDVVKFREIALRGPWTSGGIEFNYGVIGHAPSCASPVDWHTEKKADGSVSCYIGVLEMTSRSRWVVEVNLPKDAIWCTTRSVWYNLSGEWQPYYSWANSAVETSDDLVLVYPANNAIGHSGETLTYPFNEEGTDISLLSNQAYGKDKSYHMVGSHKSFFGIYKPSENWGSLHWALRDEKLGRKYFTWAQSAQGTIWIDLLTDTRNQYVELQSGRLFNQNQVASSTSSSYRQFLFSPYGTDEWKEYWLPYEGIGAADNVTLDAVTSVSDGKIGIYPLRAYDGPIKVTDDKGHAIYEGHVSFKPGRPWTMDVRVKPSEIRLGTRAVWQAEDERTDRPQSRDAAFDPNSVESLVLMARDYLGLKLYDEAEQTVDKALSQSPLNLDALSLKSALLYHRMKYLEAYEYASKALSVDQYNAEAGYLGGLAAVKLGKDINAMDRFEVAAISDGAMRSGCYTELSRLHFIRGEVEMAADYARKALKSNAQNMTALMILVKAGGANPSGIRDIDPLSHFPDAEDFLSGRISAQVFADGFRSEIIWEDFLELAAFYSSLSLDDEATRILSALPSQNALTALWTAYLKKDISGIAQAEQAGVDFTFPFRAESAAVLEWSKANGGGWQTDYMLSILKNSLGYQAEALELLNAHSPSFAPFYAYRYTLSGDTKDLEKAFSLEQDGWRYRRLLALDRIEKKDYARAVTLLEKFYKRHPENFQVGDALMDAYIGLGRYKDAEKIIDKIVYLPFEGQKGSHDKYRDIKLHIAAQECDKGNFGKAFLKVQEAREWPERLGAGKPFDNLVDTSREDWVESEILKKQNGQTKEALYPRLDDSRTSDQKLF